MWTKEYRKKYHKAYYKKNRKKLREYQQKLKAEGKHKKYYMKRKLNSKFLEYCKEYQKKYLKNNKLLNRLTTQKHRALKLFGVKCDNTITVESILKLKKRQKDLCAVCEADISEIFSIDHIKALKHGGEHSIKNIRLTCPGCNRPEPPNSKKRSCKKGKIELY